MTLMTRSIHPLEHEPGVKYKKVTYFMFLPMFMPGVGLMVRVVGLGS